MAENIRLTVQEQNNPVNMTVDPAIIIPAISPSATVTQTYDGAIVTVTDKNGTTQAEIHNGKQGKQGEKGEPGQPGQPGVSPTISVTDITGGHRVTITDATGTHSFDVMDSTGGVTDVQVNGASIVTDGVANVPTITSTSPGVAKVDQYSAYGINVRPDGTLQVVTASDAQIKSGTSGNDRRPITPSNQHISVFYGLAKVAGFDEKNSTLPVGQYTDEAKIAIQKMLGIYEAPWELIREETFTYAEENNHVITVDSNGSTFELTDIVMMFELPKQETVAAKNQYGQIWFYYNNSSYYASEPGTWTQEANDSAKGYVTIIEQKGGLMKIQFSNVTSSSNRAQINWRYGTNFAGTAQGIQYFDEPLSFVKVTIPKVVGTGHYKLYGKRKWQ